MLHRCAVTTNWRGSAEIPPGEPPPPPSPPPPSSSSSSSSSSSRSSQWRAVVPLHDPWQSQLSPNSWQRNSIDIFLNKVRPGSNPVCWWLPACFRDYSPSGVGVGQDLQLELPPNGGPKRLELSFGYATAADWGYTAVVHAGNCAKFSPSSSLHFPSHFPSLPFSFLSSFFSFHPFFLPLSKWSSYGSAA